MMPGLGSYRRYSGFAPQSVVGSIVPASDNLYDLGTAALRWRLGYFHKLDTDTTNTGTGGIGADITLTQGAAAITGTLRGAYIVATNGTVNGTGTIRGVEIKARAANPSLSGANIGTLEGASIDADAKNKTITTMRAIEAILDGQSGAAITEAVGIRIANNFQAAVATTSYGLQIYRDSFDFTADIQLSSGGRIGGASGELRIASGGPITAATNFVPDADGTRDLGSSALKFHRAFIGDPGVSAPLVLWANSTAAYISLADGDTTPSISFTATQIDLSSQSVVIVKIGGGTFEIPGGVSLKYAASNTQTLAASGTVTPYAHAPVAGSGGAVTLTSTPSVTIAGYGQGFVTYIRGTHDTNTLTFQDEGTLTGSKLQLGAATRTLGAGDTLALMLGATGYWEELFFSAI